jgi:hypothetical protein
VADRFEARIAAIAGRQHRNISRAQLLELGVGPGAITHRLRSGRLHRQHAGVYAVGTAARTLTRTVNDALHTPYLTRNQLAEVCARHPNHVGAKLLLPFYDAADGPSRSGWEDTLKAWCADHGLPEPLTNHQLGGYEVDGYFPRERLVIELDSIEFHSSRDAILIDRERDACYLDRDIESVRITYDRYEGGAASEAARLSRILARRRQMLAAMGQQEDAA